MATKLTAIRGMNDILPDDIVYWDYLFTHFRRLADSYCYREIRTPLVESTQLFYRLGEATDIVEKETYTFDDRNGDSLTLRPEGTAGTIRAGIENGLFYNQIQRLWYMGPIFRHERPQKGRYRQFYQIGMEAVGMSGPDIDTELLYLTWQLWQNLGLADSVRLEINSLGSFAEREQYTQRLIEYFTEHKAALDEDSVRRLEKKNPLRILDSKNPALNELIANAPSISESLSDESSAQFEQICTALEAAKIPYIINPRLVRGIDYYCHLVFEWITNDLGAQGTLCAGGRYDALVSQIGGADTPAVGFAMGMERILLLLEAQGLKLEALPDVYFISDVEARSQALLLSQSVRRNCPNLKLLTHCGAGSFKSQMKKADKSGAQYVLILGEDELAQNTITLKPLRQKAMPQTVAQDELVKLLTSIFTKEQ
jgi:histidyl-tRNA synthetase